MKRIACATLTLAVGLLLALAPGGAWAVDGTITGLSFSPATGVPNQDVTITVQGTLKCKKVNVNFGDQSPVVTLDNPDFENNNQADNSATHAYSSAGSYTVTATALEQCTGAAQKTLTVGTGGGAGGIKPGLEQSLCKILDNCPKFQIGKSAGVIMHFLPTLEGIFPFSIIEPGGAVIVNGKGFGNTKGELHLYLKTDNKDVKLTVETWGNNGIGAKIPSTTIGVVDQQGEFYVKTAAGFESNRKGPVSFTAKRGIKFLPRSDVQVAFFGCGTDSNCDQCLNWSDPDNGGCFSGVSASGAVAAWHYNCWGCVGDDSDRDTYTTVPLKNGWVLDKVYLHHNLSPSEGSASAKISQGTVVVDWVVTPNDGLSYYGEVAIKGPMLTPYK